MPAIRYDLCAFCETVEIEYRAGTQWPDGFGTGGIFEKATGERHYPKCAEWQKASS